MIFIFPKNYDFSFKFLGLFNYSSIFLNIIWGMFVYFIVSFLFGSFIIRFYTFTFLFLPFFLFSILNKSNENIFFVCIYLIRYFARPKVFFYDKRF